MKRMLIGAVGLIAAVASATAANADTFVLNYEAPGVQNTTATFSVKGVETFNEQPTGTGVGFTTDYGTGAITGTYSGGVGGNGVQINQADVFGGAGGTGNYIVAFGSTPYTLSLVADPILDPQGINYFGYWLSALDDGNQVTFLKNGVQVGALSPSQVIAKLGTSGPYYGNPNPPFQGGNIAQPYVFINFYDLDGTFDEVAFSENPAIGGYESDNHTVGFFTHIGGVPEPSTWAMLLLGFAGLGFAGYRSTRRAASATA
jgi:PEP-CTERM motif